MKAVRLSCNLAKTVPFSFELFNSSLPCWNYLLCGGNRNERNKLASSILLSSIFKAPKTLVYILSTSAPDEAMANLIKTTQGTIIDLNKTPVNILDFNLSKARIKPSYLKSVAKEILQHYPDADYDVVLENILDGFDHDFKKTQQLYPLVNPNLFSKNYNSCIPTEEQLHQITDLVSQLFYTQNISLFLFHELHDYYLKIKDLPNLINFVDQSENEQLKKAFPLLPKTLIEKYASTGSLDLPYSGVTYIFSKDNISSTFVSNNIYPQLAQRNCRKILVLDVNDFSFFRNDFLNNSRKLGMSILELKENFEYSPSHHVGVFCLNLKSEVSKVLDRIPSLAKVINENFLRYDLGLKGIYGKTHLNYKSNQLKDLVFKNPSLAQSLLLESEHRKTVEVKPGTPYLSAISKISFNNLDETPYEKNERIGIWDSSSQDLEEKDLLLFNQKLSNEKLAKGIVILKNEILEHELYHKYNYKNCSYPMVFKTKEDLLIEINNFNDLESKNHKLEVPKSSEPNCFILFIDPYDAGLIDLELN